MSVVGALPFMKPLYMRSLLSQGRRHTLPASEFRSLSLEDAISVFEIEREGKQMGCFIYRYIHICAIKLSVLYHLLLFTRSSRELFLCSLS